MSQLARRMIGESSNKETRTYKISARPDHLDEIERFFSWINTTRGGHSGTAKMFVDGDGAARVDISREGGELQRSKDVKSKCNGEPEYSACLDSKDQVMEVIKGTRPVEISICPHCRNEIHEKHTYSPDGGITEVHSDCGGKIAWPETPMEDIAAWLRPYVQQVRDRKAAGLPLF